MSDPSGPDNTGHAADCAIVTIRQEQLDWYGAILEYWPEGGLCTCHHWWRYNPQVPPPWYAAQVGEPDAPKLER